MKPNGSERSFPFQAGFILTERMNKIMSHKGTAPFLSSSFTF